MKKVLSLTMVLIIIASVLSGLGVSTYASTTYELTSSVSSFSFVAYSKDCGSWFKDSSGDYFFYYDVSFSTGDTVSLVSDDETVEYTYKSKTSSGYTSYGFYNSDGDKLECYIDEDQYSTHWYKGSYTVTVYATDYDASLEIPVKITAGSSSTCYHLGGTWSTTSSGKWKNKCIACGTTMYTLPYKDISDYKGYVNYISYTSYYNTFIKGTSSTTFAPKKALTKAALITILYRMAGSPSVSGYSNPYSDVKSSAYYYEAALWAYKKGITTDKTFDGSEKITREKTVTFLYRFAKKFTDADLTTKSISSFPDASKVSSYAKTPMKWAYKNGLITGNDSGKLNPKGKTLRIYATKILYKFGVACQIGNFATDAV